MAYTLNLTKMITLDEITKEIIKSEYDVLLDSIGYPVGATRLSGKTSAYFDSYAEDLTLVFESFDDRNDSYVRMNDEIKLVTTYVLPDATRTEIYETVSKIKEALKNVKDKNERLSIARKIACEKFI